MRMSRPVWYRVLLGLVFGVLTFMVWLINLTARFDMGLVL